MGCLNSKGANADIDSKKQSNPLQKTAPSRLVSIELLPHEHTLFCERKTRVCTAAGKIQELEVLKLNFSEISSLSKPTGVWLRQRKNGSGEDVRTFEEIPESRGKDTLKLSLNEMDRMVSYRMDIRGEKKMEGMYALPIGPVLPGPPRICENSLVVSGQFFTGGKVRAHAEYIGGWQGPSEYWWLRVKGGQRTELTQPRAVPAPLLSSPDADNALAVVGSDSSAVAEHDSDANHLDDPRCYVISEEDQGSTLKVKVRPIRKDGIRGDVFTSLPSPVISASTTAATELVAL
jgi:hypothetical protein